MIVIWERDSLFLCCIKHRSHRYFLNQRRFSVIWDNFKRLFEIAFILLKVDLFFYRLFLSIQEDICRRVFFLHANSKQILNYKHTHSHIFAKINHLPFPSLIIVYLKNLIVTLKNISIFWFCAYLLYGCKVTFSKESSYRIVSIKHWPFLILYEGEDEQPYIHTNQGAYCEYAHVVKNNLCISFHIFNMYFYYFCFGFFSY